MKKIKILLILLSLLVLVGCKEPLFTVKYLGFNDELLKTIEVSEKDTLVYPTAPTITGYEFIGWDQTLTNVSSDVTIKAIYEANKYTVMFFDMNGSIISKQEVEYGKSAVAPTPTIFESYAFVGWDTDFSAVTKNLDVTALYEKNAFIVTFVDMYGEVVEKQVVSSGKDATTPKAPSIKYYTFKKWEDGYKNVNSDVTIKAIYEKNYMDFDKENVNYWLQTISAKFDIDKVILTQVEINQYNQTIINSYNKTKVVDVTLLNQNTSKDEIKRLIENYSNIYRYTVFNETTKKELSADELKAILDNRDLENINGEIKYGIITDFSLMRSYPTMHFSSDYDMDRFQETSLNVGEGVFIYHTSKDGNWYFVQAENYNGWVKKSTVGLCSYEELNSFLKNEDRIVVISDYVILEKAHVRMGQSFPKLSENGNTYTINFPTRNANGALILKELTIEKGSNYSDGYLEYTYENILKQAFKILGIDYSWGDKDKFGRDCSSTQNAIYKTFGFMMPRNTSNQLSIPTYGKTVNGISSNLMQKNYQPGTLIFTSGHVMMYIGEDENGVSYLYHNTTSNGGGCIIQPLEEYGTSRIIGILRLQ